MKRLVCFLCITVIVFVCNASVFAENGNVEFSPVTAGSFRRSALDWYADELCIDLCIYLLHDSGLLDEFLEGGVCSRTYIVQNSALLFVVIDLGERTIGYNYIPALGTASYSILSEGETDGFLFFLLTKMMTEYIGDEAKAKIIPEELWNQRKEYALDSIGIVQTKRETKSPAFSFADFLNVKCQDDIEAIAGAPESISEKFGTYYYCVSLMDHEFSLHVEYNDRRMIEEISLNSVDDRIENLDAALSVLVQSISNKYGQPDRFDSPANTTTFTWIIDDWEMELQDWADLGLGSRLSIFRSEN